MGGRSGSGGGGGAGGVFRMPTLTGTPKQIAYAQSILTEGINIINGNLKIAQENAAHDRRLGYIGSDFELDVQIWKYLRKKYIETANKAEGFHASKVIDSRFTLSSNRAFNVYHYFKRNPEAFKKAK